MVLITILLQITSFSLSSPTSFTVNDYRIQLNSIEIHLVGNKSEYHVKEPIIAIIRNNYGRAIYMAVGSAFSTLQKWEGEEWVGVRIERSHGISAITYRKFKPGQTLEFEFPAERLYELGEEVTGLYRFSVTISPDRNYDNHLTVKSPEFRVLE
jgi:hypothetical protein